MKEYKLILTGVLILLTALMQGCAPLVLGSAATGLSVAHDRRTIGTLIEDQNIEIKAASLLLANRALAERLNVSATSYNLRVLLTGQAADEETRNEYAQGISHINQVRRVFNEISIEPFGTMSDKANDAYLTGKVNVELVSVDIRGFDPSRVKVVTERGVVYLMGLLTSEEKAAVLTSVSHVTGIQRVVEAIETY